MEAEVRQKREWKSDKSRSINWVGDLMQPYGTFFQKMAT